MAFPFQVARLRHQLDVVQQGKVAEETGQSASPEHSEDFEKFAEEREQFQKELRELEKKLAVTSEEKSEILKEKEQMTVGV